MIINVTREFLLIIQGERGMKNDNIMRLIFHLYLDTLNSTSNLNFIEENDKVIKVNFLKGMNTKSGQS